MSQAPVSCLPVSSKMSKAKKVLDEARETQNRELDLVEKGIVSFDEMPGLCEYIYIDTKSRSPTLHPIMVHKWFVGVCI